MLVQLAPHLLRQIQKKPRYLVGLDGIREQMRYALAHGE